MIRSVVRAFHWSPKTINKLFVDEDDHEGLVYWFKDCEKTDKEVKAAYKAKK